MKKTRFMAIVLVVAVMLMGAGYAVWTQDISLTTQVETGKLEVSITGASGNYRLLDLENTYDNNTYAPDGNNDKTVRFANSMSEYNLETVKSGVENQSKLYDNEAKTVDMYFKKLVPGTTANLKIHLKNTGTVPATLQNIIVDNSFYEGDAGDVDWDGNGDDYDDNNKFIKARAKLTVGTGTNLKVYKTTSYNENEDGVKDEFRFLLNGDFEKALRKTLVAAQLDISGNMNTAVLEVFYRLEDNAPNDSTENIGVKSTIKFDFVQSNLYETGIVKTTNNTPTPLETETSTDTQ